MRRCAGPAALVLAAAALGGCSSAADVTGLVAGGAAGGATANPAVGYAVGLSVQVAADAGYKWIGRTRQHGEQDAIASVAATLPEGGAAPWRIRHTIPIGNEGGEVRVVRVIATPLADCREVLFSVEEKPTPATWYGTSICHEHDAWHWALAEPAVDRWGFLQQ
jgi:hypothetical protein